MATNNTKAPEKDIVSFNQALELCSIGYDEPTFCMYEIENRQLCLCHIDEEGLYMPDKDLHAPTKGQVFRWFRERYLLDGLILPQDQSALSPLPLYFTAVISYNDGILKELFNTTNKDDLLHYDTYEEAENACIDKLIEIAKQK